MLPAVWVNGRRESADGRHVSARDRGFTLADGLFETMRVRYGRVFRLDRHLARLHDALAAMAIPAPPELREWVLAAVPDPSSGAASMRVTVTRGVGAGGVPPPADAEPTVVVAVSPFPLFPRPTYDPGLAVHIASGRRNERAMTAGLKTIAFTDAVAALLEARRAGADDALFLDTAGHCSEATSSNLFLRSGGVLVTPPVSCGALPGITRAAVLEIAAALGLAAEEREVAPDDLLHAEELFLTSSLRGIAPVARVDGRSVGTGSPGAITRQVAAAYAEMVERECGG
jgi:branched-chain amino acid aminotransferase